jgi:tRNA threonylcarbamoyladenosine modification (KEOPS) complex Cgi121 subunit
MRLKLLFLVLCFALVGLFDVSLVKARLILDWRQAGAAAAKAATSVSRDRAVARSLGAEVLYYLSSGEMITY